MVFFDPFTDVKERIFPFLVLEFLSCANLTERTRGTIGERNSKERERERKMRERETKFSKYQQRQWNTPQGLFQGSIS